MEVKRGHAWDNPETWRVFSLMYDLPKIPVVHLWTETQYYCMSKTNAFFTQ